MFRYPYTHLFWQSKHSIVIAGPHIQVLDTNTGDVLHSTARCEEDQIASSPIRCAALSDCGKYLATSGDDKKLNTWQVDDLKHLSSRVLPKKPTYINFADNKDILVADKFGDIFRYQLHPNSNESSTGYARDALSSHENPSGGELILGHASLLTTFLLTADGRYIVTADRDEHIRVSWFPQGYTIESYCLGHQKYVSALHIPSFSPGTLISGGGDSVLKLWDWMSGKLLRNIDVLSAVQPFIAVKAPKKRREWKNEDEDIEPIEGEKGRRKNKGKRKEKRSVDGGDAEESQDPTMSERQPGEVSTEESEVVFVVHRIASIPSLVPRIVFSAVGATAIFWFSMDSNSETCIRHEPFYKPIIDFTLEDDGSIWVLLDADRSSQGGWSSKGEGDESNLVEVRRCILDNFTTSHPPPLALALNSCTLPATQTDLKVLDLYSDLLVFPKHLEAVAEDRIQDLSEIGVDDTVTADDGSNDGGITKRELGRLKHKQALWRLREAWMGHKPQLRARWSYEFVSQPYNQSVHFQTFAQMFAH
ncbi:WD40-repeat-containing domain protein [Suillus bovinus]|uniref:WD40-repeat-containing domain protein n=1 Tax=Suillus bovinus TaxID=48563 RepID=UPI001B871D55|nr:WD40-repeat-containing domain protein [Suillus bovinus]KAG2150299.1 WD40-repeat-containing domain protein [Suillus bovinus]